MTVGDKCAAAVDLPQDSLAARILDEAIRLFASRGYASTSVREVVEACGCTKPALYYHFTNKVGLYRAAIGAAVIRLEVVHEELSHGAFVEGLREGIRRVRAHAEVHPDDLRLLFRAESEATIHPDLLDIRTLRAQDLARTEALIAEGVERGELRKDLPVKGAAIALVGAMHMWLQLWLDGHPLDDEFEQSTLSLYLHGVIA
ncbi:MAG: TetR/AcrR family transcriptional regulator [Nannocystales bacterium]